MKKPVGVTCWGLVLILMSLFQIFILFSAGYEHYQFLHQEYSPRVIQLRYAVSWGIKIFGMIVGAGLLMYKEIFRKLAILNSLFIICTVCLKHSYAAYSRHTAFLDATVRPLLQNLPPDLTFSSITWPALIIQRLIDVLFGGLLIFYLTRPRVKNSFT